MNLYQWQLYKISLTASFGVLALCLIADQIEIFLAFVLSIIPITIRHPTLTYAEIVGRKVNYAGWYILSHPSVLFLIGLLIIIN